MLIRTIVAFVIAVAVTLVAGSLAHTHFVLNELQSMGAPVPMDLRINTSITDLVGLAPTFAPIIAGGLFVAFIAAGFTARLAPSLRWFVFMVAGGAAMVVILIALKASLGTVGIFGARGLMGHAAQALAGMLGGLTFSILKPAKE